MAKSSCLYLLQIILLLPFFQFPARISAIRMDISLQENFFCRNTVQGRYLLSDDNGHVCDALSVDQWSRCCPGTGEKFSCHGCNLASQCCDTYEFCVSCCLNPARTQKELALQVKIAKPVTAGTYASVFDFCTGRCRHNSESVVHENAYVSDFHHCFSLPSNSSGTLDIHSEARLTGINIVVGRQGETCNSVCKSKGQSCVPSKLAVLNKCEIMQKYLSCKGSCLASIGSDQPAEVAEDAPKHLAQLLLFYNFPFISSALNLEKSEQTIHKTKNVFSYPNGILVIRIRFKQFYLLAFPISRTINFLLTKR